MTTNSDHLNHDSGLSALEWDAFLFLNGEMNRADAAAFEEKLEAPEVAQALSRVSVLDAELFALFDDAGCLEPNPGPTVVAAGSVVAPEHAECSSVRQSQSWFVVASLVACLAVVISAMRWSDQADTETLSGGIAQSSGPVDEVEQFALADRWSSLPIDRLEGDELLGAIDGSVETLELAMVDPVMDGPSNEEIVPGWMFAAIDDDATGVFVE